MPVSCDVCGTDVHPDDVHWPHDSDCTHRHPPLQHGCVGCTCDSTTCAGCCTDCQAAETVA